MTWTQRALAGIGTAGLAVLTLSGCGGSDEPAAAAATTPAASVDDFCATWEDALNGLAATGSAGPTEEQWDAVTADLTKLAAMGAPEGLSDDAAEGLPIFTDALTALSAADMKRLRGADNLPGVTDADEARARQFNSEAARLCEPAATPTR
ncbi:MAG TPA: hypothetical protein VNS55_05885 [Nocardioides sp.]|nr:hypothetical protein [Nocardioides sp.]